MSYTMKRSVDGAFDDVLERTTAALKDEGFGVLSDIDLQATFAKKLDEEIDQYRILGACNPPLAYEGVSEEQDLGAILPCNVAIYETSEGDVVVSSIDPHEVIGLTGNPALDSVADEVEERLERVLDAIAAA